MDVRCEHCRAVLHLSDERVPSNGTFRLTCPRCKRKIVGTLQTFERREDDKIEVGMGPGVKELPTGTCDHPQENSPGEMMSLKPGQSAALLGVDRVNASEGLIATLAGMGYVVDVTVSVDQALQRLRFNQYQIILLTEDFDGGHPNPVTEYLAGLNMNIRRDLFVVLIGQRFKTSDHLQAFSESVNLVLHRDDLPQLETVLAQGLRDQERFYKVFINCLIESGKKI